MPPAVLYVDDDRPNLDVFRRCFDEDFEIVTAESAAAALEILHGKQTTIGVVISDQRMPGKTGIELLVEVAQLWPPITRMMLTAYSDRDLLLAAINRGHVHDYVLKPWNAKDLGLRLRNGLDRFERQQRSARADRECESLRETLREEGVLAEMIGLDGGLRALASALERVFVTTGARPVITAISPPASNIVRRTIATTASAASVTRIFSGPTRTVRPAITTTAGSAGATRA